MKCLLFNDKNQFLILERSKEKYPEVKDIWDIPGGRIDPGVDLITNLKREVMEETQLRLLGEPKLIAAQDILRIPGRHVVRLIYTCKCEGKLVIDQTEAVAYKWVTLEEVKFMEGVDMYLKNLIECWGVRNI